MTPTPSPSAGSDGSPASSESSGSTPGGSPDPPASNDSVGGTAPTGAAPTRSPLENLAVVKIGGTLLEQVGESDAFWTELRRLRKRSPVVLVHGGGAQATRMARRLDHEPTIVEGRRVTTDLDLKIVLWTMCGELNARLVAQAHRRGFDPVGLTGADGALLQVEKRPPWTVKGEEVDFGWVGDVRNVRTDLVATLLEAGHFPVLAPLGVDEDGRLFNVNADTVACRLAAAAGAREFLLLTGSGGVQREVDDPTSRIPSCDRALFERGLYEGWIRDGMKVKLTTAFDALEGGVETVYICSPDDLTERTRGTEVTT